MTEIPPAVWQEAGVLIKDLAEQLAIDGASDVAAGVLTLLAGAQGGLDVPNDVLAGIADANAYAQTAKTAEKVSRLVRFESEHPGLVTGLVRGMQAHLKALEAPAVNAMKKVGAEVHEGQTALHAELKAFMEKQAARDLEHQAERAARDLRHQAELKAELLKQQEDVKSLKVGQAETRAELGALRAEQAATRVEHGNLLKNLQPHVIAALINTIIAGVFINSRVRSLCL